MHDVRYDVPQEVAEHWVENYIPTYHVCVRGPTPFGATEPIRIKLNYLICASSEEAAAEALEAIEHMCENLWEKPFIPDEWEVIHTLVHGGN